MRNWTDRGRMSGRTAHTAGKDAVIETIDVVNKGPCALNVLFNCDHTILNVCFDAQLATVVCSYTQELVVVRALVGVRSSNAAQPTRTRAGGP
jgi:hypothetical protein